MDDIDLLELLEPQQCTERTEPDVHVYGNSHLCKTDSRGFATPRNMDPATLWIHAPGGFISLWEQNMLLRFRFDEVSLRRFRHPESIKTAIRGLFGEAVALWGDAGPIRFREVGLTEAWDFEIEVRNADECNSAGQCVLARAFFPDAGQHKLVIYPKMFGQIRQEQVETMIHEIGHIYGLRHFFANIEGSAVKYGVESNFTIMNYGADSYLTDADKADLKRLYEEFWSGRLTQINQTPINPVRPHSSAAP